MQRTAAALVLTVLTVLAGGSMGASAGQRKEVTISSGWVKLPAAGAMQTEAFLSVDNPRAYDATLQAPASDVAGTVEFHRAGQNEPVQFVIVPAYESLDMNANGTYLMLRNLKRPLSEGDKVQLSVTMETNATLTVEAIVKKN